MSLAIYCNCCCLICQPLALTEAYMGQGAQVTSLSSHREKQQQFSRHCQIAAAHMLSPHAGAQHDIRWQ